MGREATCHCKWGVEEGDCKVLLEGRELILRSGVRRRVSLSAISSVAARGSKLVFTVGHDQVELRLGVDAARRWAKAIQTPPPSLAGKLGISRATRLSVVGNIESDELKEAVAEAAPAGAKTWTLFSSVSIHNPNYSNVLQPGSTLLLYGSSTPKGPKAR
jgi:hypothetical protein